MYSFHSSLEEKNQLLHTLTTYGIETTVDRSKKKDRIREWIQASAIVEESEEGDESDVYEDSEFYEDEDNESEETDPIPMRGRHFPERRPSAATKDHRRRRGSTASRSKAPAKPVERKIPFAPQVAEERETIARFASFPNGDPNLAVRNGGDQATSTNVISDNVSPTTNGRSGIKDPARANANNSQDAESSRTALPGVKQSPPKTTTGALDSGDMVAPMSPQIPTRKNRAHTAPFSDVRSGERQAESPTARRTQSAAVLQTPEVEDSSRTKVSASTGRAGNSSAAAISRTARSAAPPVGRADRGTAAPPIGNATAAAEAQPASGGAPAAARVESSPPAVARITMPTNATSSAASHLVMQSFNALQDISAASRPIGSSGTPSSTTSPASSSSNVSNKQPGQRLEERTALAYGKDAYAHYGIAHGAILPMRVNIVRQDSAGSGSRSVSN